MSELQSLAADRRMRAWSAVVSVGVAVAARRTPTSACALRECGHERLLEVSAAPRALGSGVRWGIAGVDQL